MLRLALMTSAAVYAGLVIYSEDAPVSESAEEDVIVADAAPNPVQPETTAQDGVFRTAMGLDLTIAAVIDPSDIALDDATEVAAIRTERFADPDAQADTVMASASEAEPEPALLLVAVSGSSVNLRAGPSTNDGILGALFRGEQAEVIATLETGWAHIRVVDTGVEGYMATRFLEPIS